MHLARLALIPLSIGFLLLAGSPADAKGKKKVKEKPVVTVLKISNLKKATKLSAVKKLESKVKQVRGVTRAQANKRSGVLRVWHRKGASMEAVKAAVVAAGFKVDPPRAPSKPPSKERDMPDDD